MSHDEYPIDSTLTEELRDSLAELAVPGRPSLAAITGRGRVHRRRRRRAGLLGLGGAAAGIALILGLTGVFGAAAAPGTSTVQTADFTLTSYVDGTVSLKLSQLFDPAALQRALGQHGIPALVKIGAYCTSAPAAPNPASLGVWVTATPAGPRDRARSAPYHGAIVQSVNIPVRPSQLATFVNPVSVVINRAAIPSGTELFIGDYDLGHTIFMDLIYTKSHTCINGQKPPPVARLDRPPPAGHG